MSTRIILRVVGIKLRCQASWKWNIPDNEIVPKGIMSYYTLYIKKPTTTTKQTNNKKPKPQAASKRKKKNQKETKFTGFENDLILAALARFSVGQWKASHGTIK